jgi:exosortase
MRVSAAANGQVVTWILFGVLVLTGVWSYWPTFLDLAERWYNVPDYSHGFLVIPIAILLGLARRSSMPEMTSDGRVWGIGLVLCAITVRILSARMFLPALDGWSIPIWVAGLCLWLGGWRFLRWCSPSLFFLVFMVPLPYRAEHALNTPLRKIAAETSVFLLHCFGRPAVREGTTVILDQQEFDVADGCSGLRMLTGVVALAFAYITITRTPWWQKCILACLAIPVAVLANVLRVAATAFLMEHVTGEAARDWIHDAAGWLTFCIGAVLFLLVSWCLGKMFIELETSGTHPLIRREDARRPTSTG